MFKNLVNFWKGKDFLQQVLDDFSQMLNDAEEMFNLVCGKLINDQGKANLKEEIYKIDKRINSNEKDIRKRVIEHLTVQPSVDTATSLVLMSVVKDAERLGDYSKNLFEVTELTNKPIDKEKYSLLFDNIDQKISELFKQTKAAFIDSNEEKAKETWEIKRSIAEQCDTILKQLANGNYPSNEAVCFTLMARHFKRLSSHLTNIATSVILPITNLDYFDERLDGNK
ncbi:MAG: phosphate uptake regulator PhoU [Candidatus Omnitrophica bacterium]|nr:phosphate uptake regulator PhoU [Candidatus Omnitrophota bacterium]